MKRNLALVLTLVALLCAGCAQGGGPSAGGGEITMYGTLDQGITFHN